MSKQSFLSFIVSFFIVFGAFAQNFDTSLLEGLSVRNIGPAGMSGRITAIDVHPKNKDHIYIGSASGGVWKSKNGGINWEPIFDETSVLSIGSIEINPTNPDEIWVGTGEGNPRNSHNSGAGIFFSNDAGRTWSFMGLKETRLIHRIIVDPTDSKTVFIGAMGSAWGNSDSRGVFRTKDQGKTWEKVLFVNESTGVADMVIDPSNPKKIIAALWDFGRKPWTFTSGGDGSGLYMTLDGGDNWKEITSEDGLPSGELGRIGLAFAKNKTEIVYALVEAEENGLYKSNDGGHSWELVSTENIGNRPFYYSELYVDPQNENRIYNVYTYLSKSEDGGKTFKEIANYGNSVHPDHHAFWIDPDNPDYLIDGNDGGLNISRDGGENWRFVSNIPVGQFYHINHDMDFPYNVYGGMQDNGTWIGPSTVFRRGGIINADWQELYFGDGFDVMPDVANSRYGYAMSQGGNVGRYDRITGRTQMVKPVHPEDVKLRYNWNAAMAQDPFNDCGIYFGSQFVHYSDDCGLSWKIISPDLTTNDTTKQKQDISGGLTIDATNAENYTTLLAIAPSPFDENVIWAASDDGKLHITKDGGENWKDVAGNLPGFPKGGWIPQIEISTVNAAEAFIVANDYRRNNWSAYAYHTTNYGKSWTRIIDDSDINSFICSIVQDDDSPNLLFAGADNGLYVSINKGKNWSKWNEEMPPVQIRDMKIHPREKDLIIGTFGRAIWIVDDIRPLQDLAKNSSILDEEFTLLESGDAYNMYSKSYKGIRFYGQSEFIGVRKPRNARINYFLNKVENKEKDDSKVKKEELEESKSEENYDDKIRYVIIDMKGDTLRRRSQKAKSGFNQLSWGLEMKGVDWPSARDRDRDEDYEPSGPDVLPGTYKIVATYKGIKDSLELEVKSDPRIDYNMDKSEQLEQKYKEFYGIVEEAAVALDKLKEAKKTIDIVDRLTYSLQDSTKTRIEELNKEKKEEIQDLIHLYVMPEGLKGIQRNPDKLNSRLGTASWYLGSRWDEIGQNTENLMENTNASVKETLTKVNDFFENSFQTYKSEVEKLDFELFKKIEDTEN